MNACTGWASARPCATAAARSTCRATYSTPDGLARGGRRHESKRGVRSVSSWTVADVIRRAYGIAGRAAPAGPWQPGSRPSPAGGGISAQGPRPQGAAFTRRPKTRRDRAAGLGAVVTTLGRSRELRAARASFSPPATKCPRGVPREGHRVTSTWALATRPQPRAAWRDKVMISEASDPYLYLRVRTAGPNPVRWQRTRPLSTRSSATR